MRSHTINAFLWHDIPHALGLYFQGKGMAFSAFTFYILWWSGALAEYAQPIACQKPAHYNSIGLLPSHWFYCTAPRR